MSIAATVPATRGDGYGVIPGKVDHSLEEAGISAGRVSCCGDVVVGIGEGPETLFEGRMEEG